MPLCRRNPHGEDFGLTISGTSALKYAVSKAGVWSYPRQALYDFIRRKAKIADENDFSDEDSDRVKTLAGKLAVSNPQSPALRILLHDVSEVSNELEKCRPIL
jgi:hypothetical protein